MIYNASGVTRSVDKSLWSITHRLLYWLGIGGITRVYWSRASVGWTIETILLCEWVLHIIVTGIYKCPIVNIEGDFDGVTELQLRTMETFYLHWSTKAAIRQFSSACIWSCVAEIWKKSTETCNGCSIIEILAWEALHRRTSTVELSSQTAASTCGTFSQYHDYPLWVL